MTATIDFRPTPTLSKANSASINTVWDQTPILAPGRLPDAYALISNVLVGYQTSLQPLYYEGAALRALSRAVTTSWSYELHLSAISSGLHATRMFHLLCASRDDRQEPAVSPVRSSTTERVLTNFDELKRWLSLTEQRVAQLCGFARRNLRNWRSGGREPYPATVRGLFEVHSIAKALIEELGLQGARSWLDVQTPDGSPRLEMLSTPAGRRELIEAAGNLMFERVQDQEMRPEDSQDTIDKFASPRNSSKFRDGAAVRRTRKR